jgi:hypothetical protein
MLSKLQTYYHEKGISAESFSCPYYPYCSNSNPTDFTTAKEAFVSSGYENHILPRILFLSLDSGSASNNPAEKTLASVRQQEEIECQVWALPRHKHWYRTHELAYHLLRHFKRDLTVDDAKHYFAHANSAKCCLNNPQRAQADPTLFNNCRAFIPGEIEILAPDVLVTQGDYAKWAIQNAFMRLDVTPHSLTENAIPDEVTFLLINGNPVIWIHTFHPRNPNSKKNRDNYSLYEKIVYEFIAKRPLISLETVTPTQTGTKKPSVKNIVRTVVNKADNKAGNYIFLDEVPPVPANKFPTHAQASEFEYMLMTQLCNIVEKWGYTRGWAARAFGGDKGKIDVEPERMARAACDGNQLRKFVLVSAVDAFFKENNIIW